jgi:hypothetical protein
MDVRSIEWLFKDAAPMTCLFALPLSHKISHKLYMTVRIDEHDGGGAVEASGDTYESRLFVKQATWW